MDNTGTVHSAIPRALDAAYAEWLQEREHRKAEEPDGTGDTYGLLLLLMDAVLKSPDPQHLSDMECFLVRVKAA